VAAALWRSGRAIVDLPDATVVAAVAAQRGLAAPTSSSRRRPTRRPTPRRRRALRPGRYRVTVTAVAGGRSAAAVQTVTVRRS
jgi:hypothetical protein